MAFNHFLRNSRQVRLGGWRIFGRQFGGGWYTVGPLSVLRFLLFVEASGQLSASPAELTNLANIVALRNLMPLVPLLVLEPVEGRHLRRLTMVQLTALFVAVGQTNDLEYCMNAIKPGEKSADDSDRVGFEVIAVTLAERLHVGDPYSVLSWPMQEVLGICDAFKDADGRKPDAPEAQKPHQVDDLAVDLKRLGIVVS